jgi:hypothetical protein
MDEATLRAVLPGPIETIDIDESHEGIRRRMRVGQM